MILNAEQLMMRETVAQFFAERAPISRLRALEREPIDTSYDVELWSDMVALGLTGITVPEVYDGLDFGWLGLGAIAQEAGRCLVASPLLSSVVMGQNVLLNCGSRAQIERYLPAMLSGDSTSTLALDEGRAFDPESIVVAERAGTMSGRKIRVLDAPMCSLIFSVARRESGELGVALVSADSRGIAASGRRLMDLRDSGSVVFEALQTETIEWLEGLDIRGGLQKTLDQATAVLAAEMMGTAREALERTVTFLGEREQFDVKLGTFQALQHRCAQMYCELELADSAVAAALVALDHDAQNTSSLVSSAKALANDCLTLISSESVQLHGGMGVTEEMDMGLFLKRSRVCNQLLGSSSYHRDRYARLNGF